MQNLAIKYGLMMFAGFTALFLVIYALGWANHVELRSLNVFIHFGVMYALIRQYRRQFPETRDNYIKGTLIGMFASALGIIAFALVVFSTLKLDPILLGQLKGRSPMPEYFTAFNAAQYLIVEGLVVSLVGAYIVTRIVDARYDHSPAEGKITNTKSMTAES